MKSKVNFIFDKEKDLYNIWQTCNSDSDWHDFKRGLNPDDLKIAKGKNFEECRDELKKAYEKLHESKLIEIFIDSLQKGWGNVNDEFFRRLEGIIKKPICTETFISYITTVGRCPYDPEENSFMVSLFYSIPQALVTIGHEIMHIQFHNIYWEKIEKEIGNEKTADLKEALTVLLNLEFRDLLFGKDRGYDCHQKLRKFIEKEWKKEKDFEVLVEKCIEYLK